MRDLDFLVIKAKGYDLVAERVSEDTIKVYSPKYLFDSWLIKDSDDDRYMELWHLSKRNNYNKCSYHLHKKVLRRKKVDLLYEIKNHNEYVAYYKKANKINLVDRVLGGYVNV